MDKTSNILLTCLGALIFSAGGAFGEERPEVKEVLSPQQALEQGLDISEHEKPLYYWNGTLLFPSDALEPDDPDWWLNKNRYASYILEGLDEGSIFDVPVGGSDLIIRLSILPTFRDAETSRIEVTNGVASLTYKLGNAGNWGPVTDFEIQTVTLSAAEFGALMTQIERAGICSRGYSTRIGADGATWILEVKNASEYCAYTEWSPREGFFPELHGIIKSALE